MNSTSVAPMLLAPDAGATCSDAPVLPGIDVAALSVGWPDGTYYVVPPDDPSHAWPTAAETEADPFCEGCGACACLPSSDEAREACPRPPTPAHG